MGRLADDLVQFDVSPREKGFVGRKNDPVAILQKDCSRRVVHDRTKAGFAFLHGQIRQLSLADEMHAGHRCGDHQHTGHQEQDTNQPDVLGIVSPSPAGDRSHLPCPVRKGHVRKNGIEIEQCRVTEKHLSRGAVGVLAADGDLDRQILVEKTAVAVQPLNIDDCGNQTPELFILTRFPRNEHRHAADEALATLNKVDRPCDDDLTGVTGTLGRGTLFPVLTVVQTDGRFVSLHRIHEPDHHAWRSTYIPELGPRLEKLRREAGKPALGKVGFDGNRGNQTAHELRVGKDGSLQAGAHRAQLCCHRDALLIPIAMIDEILGGDFGAGNQGGNDKRRQNVDVPPPHGHRRETWFVTVHYPLVLFGPNPPLTL